jgi:hypothetical protein
MSMHVAEMYGAFKKAVRNSSLLIPGAPECPKSYLTAADMQTASSVC